MSSDEEDVSDVDEDEVDESESGSEEEEENESEEESEEEIVVPVKRPKGKKGKDPNKPKRNLSSYFLWCTAHRAQYKSENPSAGFGDLSRILAAAFRTISKKESEIWQKKAAKDKERYLREMLSYIPPDDSDDEGPRKKAKKFKDPNKPKRNMSSYFLFSTAERPNIKAANPEASFGDVARLVSAAFKALSDSEKDKWGKKAAKEKIRYIEAMKVYNENL